MQIGVALALGTFVNALTTYDVGKGFEMKLADAKTLRECAAVIAGTTEEEIIDALDRIKEGEK